MKQLPKVGDKVILGKHIDPTGLGRAHNWSMDMDNYVGKVATVRRVENGGGIAEKYGDTVRVDLDSERWGWEVFYLQPATSTASPRSSSEDGCRCSKCREFVPYVEPSDTFTCYSCRSRP